MRSHRPIPEESTFQGGPFAGPIYQRRRQVLRETVHALTERYTWYHAHAQKNLERWWQENLSQAKGHPAGQVEVYSGDWGEVTHQLTRRWGVTFAVLNMANAYSAGGAYLEGTAAQEENMFRRTDCHLALNEQNLIPLDDHHLDRSRSGSRSLYQRFMTQLLNAQDGRVYLDLKPRVCLRGAEDRSHSDLGYAWLDEDQIFSFYELRAAAVDLRGGHNFDPIECERRICAQLETLRESKIRYAVLGAHGCGAFMNPNERVANLYAKVIQDYIDHFDLIAFAIFDAGYGPDNYTPFAHHLNGIGTSTSLNS